MLNHLIYAFCGCFKNMAMLIKLDLRLIKMVWQC
jgi:hypothetical protein